jgi:hypothetical protein
MTARKLNDSTKCLLVGTPRTYFRAVINQKQPGDEFRPERWAISRDQRIKSVSVGAQQNWKNWEFRERFQREIIRDYEKTDRRWRPYFVSCSYSDLSVKVWSMAVIYIPKNSGVHNYLSWKPGHVTSLCQKHPYAFQYIYKGYLLVWQSPQYEVSYNSQDIYFSNTTTAKLFFCLIVLTPSNLISLLNWKF